MAVVGFHNAFNQAKSEPFFRAALAATIQAIPDHRKFFGRNTDSGILYPDDDIFIEPAAFKKILAYGNLFPKSLQSSA